MNPERNSSIHKIVGGDELEHQETVETLEKKFLQRRFYLDLEREKTEDEREVLESVISKLKGFLAQYGATDLGLREDQVHILDNSNLSDAQRDYVNQRYPEAGGYYAPENQEVIIFGWKLISLMDLALIVSHELIHFLSYNSLIIEGENFKTQRVGLAVSPSKSNVLNSGLKYFNKVNEAVTEELVARFYDTLGAIPQLAEEYEKVEAMNEKDPSSEITSIATKKIAEDLYEATLKVRGYQEIRSVLKQFIKEIYEKRQSDFSSEEEIFAIFAKAAMTGDIKPLASLVESTFGPGSLKRLASF